MKKQILYSLALLLGILAFGTQKAVAQGINDMKINEILVLNNASYADDHASHVGWVELHNSGYSNVNIGGAYLSIKVGDQTLTYRIPKNDSRTQIAPQGYVIFFADSSTHRGTFHTNFKLDKTGSLALLDQGQNIVDEVTYNVAAQQPDISIGRTVDDEGNVVFASLGGITPMQSNELEEKMPAYEVFRLRDPTGAVMAITAMSVVFLALIMLYLIFKNVGKFMVGNTQRTERKAIANMSDDLQSTVSPDSDLMGEEIAAIAMALKRYDEDLHDIESQVITINRVARAYSPWSSKIYGLRQLPQHNSQRPLSK